MLKKLLIIIFLLGVVPITVKAQNVGRYSFFSGQWSIIGDYVYQPTFRTVINNNIQINYPKTGFIGFGVSKDHIRLEYFSYLKKPRWVVAYDFFPKEVGTPYVGLVRGQGTVYADSASTQKSMINKDDIVLGVSFQPIPYFNVYVEYLVSQEFFFFGARAKLSFTIK